MSRYLCILLVTLIISGLNICLASCDSSNRELIMEKNSAAVSKTDYGQLKTKLTTEQFRVTQQCGTEPPFKNAYWNNHEAGIYVDIVSGEALFSSEHKFDSGTGWPSFSQPINPDHIISKPDDTLGMQRTEVRSKKADSHLGHLFFDGPGEAKQRFCINSASLRFIPVKKMWTEGYGRYIPQFETSGIKTDAPTRETAVLAGGCFWGMQDILRKIPGVISTKVGYTGGHLENPSYEDTHDSKSGHAESVEVVFNPGRISYEELLQNYFFRMHDPTTRNRQGNDYGTQYRSAIFYTNETQHTVAERVKALVDASGKWRGSIVTEIVKAGKFYPAEEYHQDYLIKNPSGYTCHYLRQPHIYKKKQ
ncbi:MAG: bifunctional methionine sulfoxide reductase B/A protein [Desulfuromonadaceae bacterium]|nr:bifunctional methionine sulfoxide reductase B/A protein [Desulfuromonadaceae bacterium]MDD2854314.1 bifunctional methionine sulfoxide reductase B/A protein [Desulfuromonadaceae bacterium]